MPRWNEISRLISCLRERIIIDCGHLPIRGCDQGFSFGEVAGPSASTLETLELGIAISRRLTAEGRKAILSICLSDTSRLLGDGSKREALAAAVSQRSWSAVLPPEYLHRLTPIELDQVSVTLQTRNSNRFSAALKKLKARALRASTPEAFYREEQAVLLTSLDGDRLAVSVPFLLDCASEDDYYGQNEWKQPDHVDCEEDIIARPMTRLLRRGLINLYEKSTGVLCPATYGGLLLNYDESSDHICLYSRHDDPDIGEKVLRGVVAANVVQRDMSRTFLQIIFPHLSATPEISLLSSARLRRYDTSWKTFVDALDALGIFHAMTLYSKPESTGEQYA